MLKRVIWAVDPFPQTENALKRPHELLVQMEKSLKVKIKPIYIANQFGSYDVAEKKDRVQKVLDQQLANSKLVNSEKPKVVVVKNSSQSAAVKGLLAEAKKYKADLIVLSTHARSGVAKLFMGSFAEKMLVSSKLPLLFTNPTTKKIRPFKRIIVPTDFTRSTKNSIATSFNLAEQYEAKLTFFHKVPDVIEPVVQSSAYLMGGGWIPMYEYLKHDISACRKKLVRLKDRASKRDITCSTELVDSPGSIEDALRKSMKKRPKDLIIMGSDASSTSAMLIGSVASQVVRSAEVPVLVHHTS